MSKTVAPRLIAALAFLIFVSLTARVEEAPAQDKNPNKFKVGILRADGTIVPFAEYRNGLWWNPWAEPTRPVYNNEVIPKSLGDQPEPWFGQCKEDSATWYFRAPGQTTIALKPRKLLQVENHSTKNWALATDYRSGPSPADRDAHHSQIGVAVDANLKVETMVELEENTREENEIVDFLRPIFETLEAEEIARMGKEAHLTEFVGGFPPSREARAKEEIKVPKLFRGSTAAAGSGGALYYVEIEKEYRRGAAPGRTSPSCENVSYLSGWVARRKDGSLDLIKENFGLTDCDGKDRGAGVELFSLMTLGGRTFIFTVEHGWEDESYVIYELKDSALVPLLETFGG